MTESEVALKLRQYWYIACESRRLGGRPLGRSILGTPLVFFRTGTGAPAALLDRCAHRSMRLSAGTVRQNDLECPYHGWTWSAAGRCTSVPSMAVAPDVTIPAFPCAESDGYVWVHMGGETAGAPPRFAHCGERGWTTFRMMRRFQASAFACLENFLDVPHTAYVHTGLFRGREPRDVAAVIHTDPSGAWVEFAEEPERRSIVGRLLFPRSGALRHTDRFVMPTTSRVDYDFGPERHFIITSQCTPVEELVTDVYTVITFRFGRIAPLVRLLFEPLSRRILKQDVAILAEQTAQIRRFGGSSFKFVDSDLLGPEILRCWRAAVDGKAVPPSSRRVTLRF